MERTVPSTVSEEIELYVRTIYSLLRSTAVVQIRTLEEAHAGTNSSLHPDARKTSPDTSAFIYAILRLPDCMPQVNTVILGQSPAVFRQHGYDSVETWEPVSARARRRRCFYDGNSILACTIASRSDIDDVIPVLTAYQIEWNKLHFLLQGQTKAAIDDSIRSQRSFIRLAESLEISTDDLERLRVIWGSNFRTMMEKIHCRKCDLGLRLLSGSLSEYWRATRAWWVNIQTRCPQIFDRPVYFVSSNTHSIVNLLSGFAQKKEKALINFLRQKKDAELLEEWGNIEKNHVSASPENFLYYVLKKAQQNERGGELVEEQLAHEETLGVSRVFSEHAFDIDTQIIDLSLVDTNLIDRRITQEPAGFLKKSDALILNIDYPLGLAAYNLLTMIAQNIGDILGVYIMGKAATLNGVRGDVMIPNVVHDEHSQNTYLFRNAFCAADVSPYLLYGTVLDNQKAVSVLGTFLQNSRIMDVIYREGYTDIEMEAGPYLSAIYEMSRPDRHPINEIVNLYEIPFDIGILHYASDTPLSKGKNLGAGTLSYYGIDSTYACSIAILRRIFHLEKMRNN